MCYEWIVEAVSIYGIDNTLKEIIYLFASWQHLPDQSLALQEPNSRYSPE